MSRSALEPEPLDALPEYFDRSSVVSQSSPPSYSGHQPGPSTLPAFTYVSRRLIVTLRAQNRELAFPTYGREAKVEGAVQVVSWDHAESLVVTLEGTLHAITMKQSIPNVTRTTRFISRTVILPLTSGETDVTARHFSFRLPIRDDSDMGMIPPTFYATSADLQVEVRYALIVTLTRRGLRKDDSLITPFGYFPEASGSRNPQLVQSPNGTLRNPIQIQSLHPSTQSSDNSEYDVVATLEADPSESPTTWITLNKQVVVVQDGQKFQASRQLTRVPNCMVAYSDGCWKLRGRLKVPSNAVSQSWSFAGVTVLYVIRIQARCKSRGSVETYVHTHPLLGPLPPLPGNRDAAPGE